MKWNSQLCLLLSVYVVAINLIAFILYGIDKKRAIQGKWRVSEKTLLLIAASGGSIGALAGMQVFRHKTKHWKFKVLNPLFLLIHIAVVLLRMV